MKVEVVVGSKKVSCTENHRLGYKEPEVDDLDSQWGLAPPYGSVVPTMGGAFMFMGQNLGTGYVPPITDLDLQLVQTVGSGSKIGGMFSYDSNTHISCQCAKFNK